MEIVLLQNIRNVGRLGEVVNVKPGFGRNYLIPTGRATRATKKSIEAFEARRQEYESLSQERIAVAKQRAEKFASFTLNLQAHASDEGRLFGSIGPREIAIAVDEQGLTLGKSEVSMPQGAIREIGEHVAELHLHSDVIAELKIVVVRSK